MTPAADPFTLRLRALTPLTDEHIGELAALISAPRTCEAERPLVEEGEQPDRLHILLDGWAARAKLLPDGRRHLSALLLPGDICDIDGLLVRVYDYGVVALTSCTVATIPRAKLLALCDRHPAIARALTWFGFVDNSLLNEAATSLARRSAGQRLARLLCELKLRLDAVGRSRATGFDLPLSQEKLAEALGLTGVHVNRSLRNLRLDGLATVGGRTVEFLDWERLKRVAGFSPGYLHFEGMRGG